MSCNNECALCCCCGPGQLVELPDYYCRFHSVLPVEGVTYNCTDTTRQFLNWELTKQKVDGATSTFLSLAAATQSLLTFRNDEDVSCFMSYGASNVYEYGQECFIGGAGSFESTGWKEVRRIQNRCRVAGTSNPYRCFRSQTWAKIDYDITSPSISIARCKVPTVACESEISIDEKLEVGDCGYLVTATLVICYKIETQSYFATGANNAPCDSLPAFSETPIGTIQLEDEGRICVTRSKVYKSLKNDPLNKTEIYFELNQLDSAIDCCKDWPSPFYRWLFPSGKPSDFNENLFKCSCNPSTSFDVEGDPCPNLSGFECSEPPLCFIDSLQLLTPAGEVWKFKWS